MKTKISNEQSELKAEKVPEVPRQVADELAFTKNIYKQLKSELVSQQTKEQRLLHLVKKKVKEINLKNGEARKYKAQIAKHVDYISELVVDMQSEKEKHRKAEEAHNSTLKAKNLLLDEYRVKLQNDRTT